MNNQHVLWVIAIIIFGVAIGLAILRYTLRHMDKSIEEKANPKLKRLIKIMRKCVVWEERIKDL